MCLKNEEGFSYIEVVISIVILIIINLYILGSYLSINRNYNHMKDLYLGNININNLLLDVENEIKKDKEYEETFNILLEKGNFYNLEETFRDINLEEEYLLMDYSYLITVKKINNINKDKLVVYSLGNIQDIIINTGYVSSYYEIFLDTYLNIDYDLKNSNFIEIDTNIKDIVILNAKGINELKEINLIGNGESQVIIILNDESVRELININSKDDANVIIDFYLEEVFFSSYILTVDMFSNTGNIINSMCKVIHM